MSENLLPQKLGAQCLVHQTHPGTTDSQRLHKRSCVAEDAVNSVEDGDCLEAAEEPPELIPGGKTGNIHTQSPQRPRLKLRY